MKPMVTGETYSKYGPKKVVTWQTASPKGHLSDMSTPATKAMRKMADNNSLMARQCDNIEIC